jgi:hypothetical protein
VYDVKPSLKAVLKRLKLSGLVPVLPDRAAYAAKAGLGPLDFLELSPRPIRRSTFSGPPPPNHRRNNA